jgi:hypothetical protein
MPNIIDAIKGLIGAGPTNPSAPKPLDPQVQELLKQNPNALPSEVIPAMSGRPPAHDINLPESPIDSARRRLQTIIQSIQGS